MDAVIVGAGFSGLYMLYRLRNLGLSVRVLERGAGVGGTWFWNRYPGARCDIESVDYAYSFSEELLHEWDWTERYATQPEILRYLNHVADKFDLRRDIEFETRVTEAHYDEEQNLWAISTEQGKRFTARYCIMAAGCLSSVNRPDFPGLDGFEGRWYHTAEWPHEGVDFTGEAVGIIGTGSTGIQAIPQIARQADRLHVFQRTPNYSMPARNRPLDPRELQEIKLGYAERRRLARESEAGVPIAAPERAAMAVTPEERRGMYEAGWRRGGINALSNAFTDFFTDPEANATAAEFAREQIRQIVRDPALAEALSPRQHIGTKRTCVDIGYYETYNRDNVELVDVRRSPIQEITARGVRTQDTEFEVDALVFAIGFDAMTGALREIDIRGVGGMTLRGKWADGPRTYLGLAVAGFPNLFVVTGPGSPSVLSNMVVSIEQHVDWIADCIAYLHERGMDRIEATTEAEDTWVAHVDELAGATLYPVANSWYVGANIPGKPRVVMPYVGGVGRYRRRCDEVAAQGYAGFELGTSEATQTVVADLRDQGIETVILGGCDTHGIMRGKRVPIGQLERLLGRGMAMCDVFWVMHIDESDLVQRPEDHRGYFPTERNGYPDILAQPDPSTVRVVPWHQNTAIILCDYRLHDGEPVPISPRRVLQRVVERARAMGLEPYCGIELEFYVLRETSSSLMSRRAADLVALDDKPSTYGIVAGSRHEPFGRLVRQGMLEYGLPIEACSSETGPGQFEINLRYAPALTAADDAFLLKTGVKELAAQQGLLATFMAKPHTDWAGNSCHIHLSLRAGDRGVFYDAEAEHGISSELRRFVGGSLEAMAELTAIFAPNPNSYRRFHPYSWAGTTATWGLDNRSTGLRAICEGEDGTRIEHRQAGGDVNPYLAAAAVLAGGLHGIEQGIEPPDLTDADVYALPRGAVPELPRTLAEAIERLAEGEVARRWLGDDFVDHYLEMLRAERDAQARSVTDWEIARYADAL